MFVLQYYIAKLAFDSFLKKFAEFFENLQLFPFY
jgi:hypothetical protein